MPAAAAAAILAFLLLYKSSELDKLIWDGVVDPLTTAPLTSTLLGSDWDKLMWDGVVDPLTTAPLTSILLGSDWDFTFTLVSLDDIWTLATSLSPQRDLPALPAAATLALRVSYNFVSDEDSTILTGVELSVAEDDACNRANFPSYLAAVAASAAITAFIF